jgi:[ribosomal protein S5]-alanine N-acetyltransferase
MISTRLVTPDDVPAIVALLRDSWEFLAPWEPLRDEGYLTVPGHAVVIGTVLAKHDVGEALPHVIVDGDRIVGRITLSGIVRGPFQSGSLGYWVAPADNGRGVATAAVRAFVAEVFERERLHRIEAGTLLHNVRSQRVLEKNGFVRYGMAPKFLKIAGRWQDHIRFQLLHPDGDAL